MGEWVGGVAGGAGARQIVQHAGSQACLDSPAGPGAVLPAPAEPQAALPARGGPGAAGCRCRHSEDCYAVARRPAGRLCGHQPGGCAGHDGQGLCRWRIAVAPPPGTSMPQMRRMHSRSRQPGGREVPGLPPPLPPLLRAPHLPPMPHTPPRPAGPPPCLEAPFPLGRLTPMGCAPSAAHACMRTAALLASVNPCAPPSCAHLRNPPPPPPFPTLAGPGAHARPCS